jgi:hypothetical protein
MMEKSLTFGLRTFFLSKIKKRSEHGNPVAKRFTRGNHSGDGTGAARGVLGLNLSGRGYDYHALKAPISVLRQL